MQSVAVLLQQLIVVAIVEWCNISSQLKASIVDVALFVVVVVVVVGF